MKIVVDAETREILGAAMLGTGCDEAVHCILDVMYAKAPYTVIQRAMHIHPTVSELIPTMLGELKPRRLEEETFVLAASEDVEVRLTLLARIEEARRQTDKLFNLVRPILCMSAPSRRDIGLFSISAIWRRSIGTFFIRAFRTPARSIRNWIDCLPSVSIRSTAVCRRISRQTGPLRRTSSAM